MRLMFIVYTFLLSCVFCAPGLVALAAATYPLLGIARFLAYWFSLMLYISYGRRLALAGEQSAGWRGLGAGFIAALVGTLGLQWIIHLPPAEANLVHTLPEIPPLAAARMLHLHAATSAALSALVAGTANGLLGALTTRWAHLRRQRSTSSPRTN